VVGQPVTASWNPYRSCMPIRMVCQKAGMNVAAQGLTVFPLSLQGIGASLRMSWALLPLPNPRRGRGIVAIMVVILTVTAVVGRGGKQGVRGRWGRVLKAESPGDEIAKEDHGVRTLICSVSML
jgi:hypothetical protein